MKCVIERARLLDALGAADRVLPSRSISPESFEVRLAASPEGLRAESGTPDGRLWQSVATLATHEPGTVAVAAKALRDAVGRLQGPIALATDGPRLRVSSGPASVLLPARDAGPAALVPPEDWREVDGQALLAALDCVRPAVCTDSSKPHMAGVHLDATHAAATDGHRLIACPQPAGEIGTLPTPGLAVVAAVIRDSATARIATVRGVLWVEAGDRTAAIGLIADRFPAWRQVVPPADREAACQVRVRAAELEGALRVIGAGGPSSVRLSGTPEGLLLSASVPDGPESSVLLGDAALARWDGAVCVAPAYLADAVRAAGGEEVELDGGAMVPIVVRGEAEKIVIVMPMRG